MQDLEETHIDKKDWERGEWDNEPDKKQFIDKDTGLPCLIVRNNGGALCGYVGVDKSHPAFELDYDEVNVDVHGGLTYADKCSSHICHEVEEGEDDNIWWLGFDCSHSGDRSPSYTFSSSYGERYRNVEYVTEEIKGLARQLLTKQ